MDWYSTAYYINSVGVCYAYIGSDDGSVILWDISPTTHAHLIQSAGSSGGTTSPGGAARQHEPAMLLPPATLPLAQLIEGGSGSSNVWPSWTPTYRYK